MAKRRLAAILAADVSGYSRLMGADEQGTLAALNDNREVFRTRVAAHGGRVVDTAGDSVLSVFESVVEAVNCAIEVQAALAERNAALADDRKMRFRIGVNLGDIIEQDDGSVYGDGVNVAARLESLAEPGGITVSESARMQIEGKLDAALTDLGTHDVKNIARPVHAYRVVADSGTDRPAAEPPRPEKPSIAVLPFDNLSGDAEQEYFADGIAEDLITALSRVRWLFVTARNSTFTYKGKAVDVKQVGREMGVRYVLEGSVRKGGNRVRVTAQLIDADTGNHLWAKRYDRELADIFAIQDELTEAITGEIEPELGKVERERAHRKPPDSLDAWESYQRGLWHIWQNTAADNAEAQRLFRRAVELDPDFAQAYAGLAYSHFQDTILGFRTTVAESLAAARQAALKAIALDDKDAMAHCTLGRVFASLGQHQAAVAEFETAISLNPSFALAHYTLAISLMLQGRPEEAIPEYDLAMRLSPHDPLFWAYAAVRAGCHLWLEQFDVAESYAQRAVRHPNTGFWAYAALAGALARQGRVQEARTALDKLLEMKPDFSRAFFERVWPNSDRQFVQMYFDSLRLAGLNDLAAQPRAR